MRKENLTGAIFGILGLAAVAGVVVLLDARDGRYPALLVATPSPTLSCSLSNNGSRSVVPGSSASNIITAAVVSGIAESLSYQASGLPAEASVSFSPSACLPPCSSTVTLRTQASTPAGGYTIAVTGTSAGGGTSCTTSFDLTVTSPPPSPPASSASPPLPPAEPEPPSGGGDDGDGGGGGGDGGEAPISDGTSPTVAFIAPEAGEKISGTVNLSASASDDTAVARVEFYLDDKKIGEDTSVPYSIPFDSSNRSTGSHTLTVIASDTSGNTATDNIRVSLEPPEDKKAPTVSLTRPTTGSVLSGNVAVSASASDENGISGVQFLLDGNNLGAEDTALPYSINWDTASASAGTHVLAARARDASGNVSESNSVTVRVAVPAPVASPQSAPASSKLEISNPNFDVKDTSVAVSWETSEPATSVVKYGEAGGGAVNATVSGELKTIHSILITGLEPATAYTITIQSSNPAGQSGSLENLTVITNPQTTPPPPPSPKKSFFRILWEKILGVFGIGN